MLEDLDDFKYARRKPWLVLVVVAVVGIVFLSRYLAKNRPPRPERAPVEEDMKPAEDSGPATAQVARSDLQSLLKEAAALEEKGDLQGARDQLLLLHKNALGTRYRAEAEGHLGRINIALVTTPLAGSLKEEYVVKPGDSVERIARRFGTTVDLIKKSNMLANANLIKAGDRLRIFKGTFEIQVSKSRNDLVVLLNGEFFKRYRVGTGKFGKTPVGTFEVTDRIPEPVWWRPDGKEVPFGSPENILGTRWLAVRATGDTPDVRGYGIHGTWDDASIGKAESAGCIRMHNKDVEELFDLIPLKTEVAIIE